MGEKLLILSCCAPCSCAVIKKMADEGVQATVLFYNPNIYPSEEYIKRRDEQRRVCEQFGLPFVELPYEPEVWTTAITGLENAPERGARCSVCFYMRLERAARYGKEHGFDAFASVLGVSRYKDLEQVNRAAFQAAQHIGLTYDDTNWRKNGLEELRKALLRELELYSQQYCGCRFSWQAAQKRRGKNEITR